MNMRLPRKTFSIFTAAGLLFQAAAPVIAQQAGQTGVNEARIQVTTELVLVNVVAHDKKGNLVRDLKKGDFTLFEDGKKQEISTFDFENVDELQTAGTAESTVSGVAGAGTLLRSGKQAALSLDARDRRLMLLFFDFSAMDPEQIDRSVEAAKKFVGTKMQPADLMALESLMQALGKLPQKKSLIYFSNGISQSGADNQSALRATTAAAVKANVSIYSLDIRGLQAFPPGGEAQSASLRGQSAYSGTAVLNDLSGNAASQDTLATLSSDTGGKAFFDSNDFGTVFSQVQKDSSAYYVLGFTSNNALKDGRFRRLKVQVNRTDLKLDFRAGYYAGRDFEHLNRADREQQLEDELETQLPRVDVPLYAGAAYFRQDDSHYYLAVSLVIPGSQIPFVTEKEKDNATIDIIGEALGGGKFRVGQLRDTVKLAVESTQQVRRKNVQYNTGFVLAPGSYHLKFIIRENQTGRIGSFETDVQIPDLRKTPLKMSSVVLSSLRAPITNKKNGANPLVRDQMELVPNITHVFAPDQHLYLQYEVYDAAKGKNPAPAAANAQSGTAKDAPAAKPPKDSIRVFTNIEFLQGATKIYESKPVVANEVTAPDRKAVIFQMDLTLQALKPGLYLCQVNVIDDVAGSFSFPRIPLLIREAVPAAPSKPAD